MSGYGVGLEKGLLLHNTYGVDFTQKYKYQIVPCHKAQNILVVS